MIYQLNFITEFYLYTFFLLGVLLLLSKSNIFILLGTLFSLFPLLFLSLIEINPFHLLLLFSLHSAFWTYKFAKGKFFTKILIVPILILPFFTYFFRESPEFIPIKRHIFVQFLADSLNKNIFFSEKDKKFFRSKIYKSCIVKDVEMNAKMKKYRDQCIILARYYYKLSSKLNKINLYIPEYLKIHQKLEKEALKKNSKTLKVRRKLFQTSLHKLWKVKRNYKKKLEELQTLILHMNSSMKLSNVFDEHLFEELKIYISELDRIVNNKNIEKIQKNNKKQLKALEKILLGEKK